MKNSIANLSLFCLLIILTSCSKTKNKSNHITCNFDELKNWNISNEAITDKFSRSGKYSIFVNPDREFSLTYESNMNDLLAKGYTKLTAVIWIKIVEPLKESQWVASVNSHTGANYVWKSTPFTSAKETDAKGWKRVEIKLDLPLIAKDGVLKIYGWSPTKEEVVLDDFELIFE